MTKQERLLLIDSLIDGSIDEADRLRIEAELIVDPDVRRDYYHRVQLSVLLRREAAELSSSTEPERRDKAAATLPLRRNHWLRIFSGSLVAIAAGVVFMIVAGWITQQSDDSRATPMEGSPAALAKQTELTASGFAVLNGQDNAVWSNTVLSEGDLLPSDEMHLISGLAHLELFSGVQLVLEGESRFRIDSPMQITMRQGIARAHVPEPAQGFRIQTVSGDVVDLGTEFCISVDQEGADVHVIDGEVELHPQGSDRLLLDAGASRRLAGSGGVTEARSQQILTVGPVEFQDRVRNKQRERYATWETWQGVVRSQPRLVAHYRFHPDGHPTRGIKNLANRRAAQASDGTIVAARRAADRWNRSDGAVDFSPIGSRIRVDIPGEHRGLTLLCWVKINSLDRWYNSLFLTDGHEDREPHWQLMDDGRIFFSVKVPSEDATVKREQPVFYSPSIWTPSLSGRWIMLAVTYDVDHQQVKHYLNGKAISNESIPDPLLVESIRVGQASICNWNEPMYRTDPEFVLRNLNGTMDEFAIFSTALSPAEIKQWYESGNPNE